jgi:hypothetical protein
MVKSVIWQEVSMSIQRTMAFGLGGLSLLTIAIVGGLSARFYLGRRRADRVWSTARYPKLKNMGTVKQLTILPLIERIVEL